MARNQLLNYKPNVFAKNLRSSSDSKLIAVCTQQHGYLEKAEFVNFLEELSASLRENFDILFCAPPFRRISNADAIIAFNVNKDTFYEIGNQNYIPLISVNCLVEDKLFFQITADYQKLKQKADDHFKGEYSFICLAPADSALREQILSVFDRVIFIENGKDCREVHAENLLTVNGIIAEFFKSQHVNLLYEPLYPPICKQAADCVHKALSREQFDIHSYQV
ncbi:MAG: hypothetical protein K2H43_02715 [Clostridia bacterium]|nr:hypothetical protein [Clostridia bacterium]